MVLESSATPTPAANPPAVRCAKPPAAAAYGTTATAATSIPTDTAAPPESRYDSRLPITMYSAQPTPAANANATPTGSTPRPDVHGVISAMPAPASTTHTTSISLREPSTATLSGPTNSTVTARPSGIRERES